MKKQIINPSDFDLSMMKLALKIALLGIGNVKNNPLVGAVLVKNKKVIATGAHLKYGSAHAEVNAINDAIDEVKGCDMYVTLEPCSHIGKTPPCVELIITRGIKRVFVAIVDPNPLVSGKGIKKLKKAGIDVFVGLCEKEAFELNQPFIKRMLLAKSYLFLKAAITLDGKLATASGHSKWISNKACRAQVDYYRLKFDAVLCGPNTLLNDNPALTIRSPQYQKGENPFRLYVTGNPSKIPLKYQAIEMAKDNKTLFFTSNDYKKDSSIDILQKKGVRFYFFEGNKISFDELLHVTASFGINSIMLEGGGSLISHALEENSVDAGEIFIAPLLLGDAKAISIFKNQHPHQIQEGYFLQNISIKQYENQCSYCFQNHFYEGECSCSQG